MSLMQKLASDGPRKLLALDGGGIRGLMTVEVLATIERTLRERLGADDSFRLSQYFDYVAGTSTGAIIASCVSLGMSVDQIRAFYRENGRAMFDRASWRRRFKYRYEDDRLAAMLREVFNGYRTPDEVAAGTDLTLGSEALQTLLLAVMRNATTDSPWPISNNPRARYNDPARADCNLRIPLWELIRASTAAPTYFPPEEVRVGDHRFLFVDGGVTMYNNPAFLVFLMSTVGAYRLEWPVGVDRMLIVSIGTGTSPAANAELTPDDMNLLYNAGSIPSALMYAALNEQDMLCRVFGRCRVGDALDREVGSLILDGEAERRAVLPRHFTYLRYNAELTEAGLSALGLPRIDPRHVQQLDSVQYMDELQEVGRAIGERRVEARHFDGFV